MTRHEELELQLQAKHKLRKGRCVAACGILLAIILLLASVATVPTGRVGVVKTFGAPNGRVLANGIHFKIPLAQSVEKLDIRIQKQEVQAVAASKDMQQITTTIAVNYAVSSGNAVKIVREIGAKLYRDTVLDPAIQGATKAVISQYTADELTKLRSEVSAKITGTLADNLSDYGISVKDCNIINFEWSAELRKAIDKKTVAEQKLLQVRTEQEQNIAKAEGAAKAAEFNAQATLTKAEAEAAANKKIAASLTPELVEWQKLRKWDGKLPTVSGAAALVDIR